MPMSKHDQATADVKVAYASEARVTCPPAPMPCMARPARNQRKRVLRSTTTAPSADASAKTRMKLLCSVRAENLDVMGRETNATVCAKMQIQYVSERLQCKSSVTACRVRETDKSVWGWGAYWQRRDDASRVDAS